MKRRRFIGLSLVVIIIATVTGWIFRTRNKKALNQTLEPNALARICGEEKLKEIGETYQQIAGENNRDSLMHSLLKDFNGPESERQNYLDQSVADDFRENRTIMIDGWLLSITEARQCALLSLRESTN